MTENDLSNPTTAPSVGQTQSMPTDAAMTDSRPAFNFGDKSSDTGGQGGGASTLKDKALTRLHGEADSRKSIVSDQLKQVSGALASIGGQTGGDAPQWLSSGAQQATQFIDRIAERIETRDTAELVQDVRSFARANPALFLGACAVAGFAAARLFSAASDAR